MSRYRRGSKQQDKGETLTEWPIPQKQRLIFSSKRQENTERAQKKRERKSQDDLKVDTGKKYRGVKINS